MVDWRWENMEDCADGELSLYYSYQRLYTKGVLANDSALNLKVEFGLHDEFHDVMSLILRLLARCVGLLFCFPSCVHCPVLLTCETSIAMIATVYSIQSHLMEKNTKCGTAARGHLGAQKPPLPRSSGEGGLLCGCLCVGYEWNKYCSRIRVVLFCLCEARPKTFCYMASLRGGLTAATATAPS